MFYTINIRKAVRSSMAVLLAFVVLFGVGMGFSILYPFKYIELISETASDYGLKPEFVCAVIHAESKFDKDALSKKGAGGLMQIMESTALWLAKEMELQDFTIDKLFEPETNIKIGCYYLSKLLKQYDGDATLALAAYNAGSGNVDNWLKDPRYTKDGKLSYIPFAQTRSYIEKTYKNIKIYKALLKVLKNLEGFGLIHTKDECNAVFKKQIKDKKGASCYNLLCCFIGLLRA